MSLILNFNRKSSGHVEIIIRLFVGVFLPPSFLWTSSSSMETFIDKMALPVENSVGNYLKKAKIKGLRINVTP
jgi:hypothetical protein